MILLLLVLLVFVAGAATIMLLHPDAGYVLINYGPWVVETSLAVLVIGVGLWFLLVYLVLRLLGATIRLPGSVREAIDRRRQDRARDSFEAGLLNLFEGNWKRAEVELLRRAGDHRATHLNYLAAARAAQRQGAIDRRDQYLRLAAINRPEHEFATLLSAGDLQRKRGDYAAARATALRLRERDPNHPFAVELLAESLAALGEWEPLRQLLAEPVARAALDPPRYDALSVRSLEQLMQAAIAAARLDQLKALWDGAPAYQGNAALRLVYARGLARLNADAEALALVAQTLAREWDAPLAQLYGGLHANDTVAQLATVEQWLMQYGDKPELLQVAGRVCLSNKLWGKARSYLEAGLAAAPTAQGYLDLARLCQDTQQPEEAARYYRQGLELATGA
ncbi:MAG TPA: heme biosynthesis HemY N-terminal domain-containing protein [Nevskia sp.]|nr:heme biosynthesis HemY N-terminal domain-containing protein [Nevskia sp.]